MSENKLKIYKASAGSGKTFTLANEYIQRLFESYSNDKIPTNHRHILAVTFTNKAAGEMKQRVLRNLYNLANGNNSVLAEMLTSKYNIAPDKIKRRASEFLAAIMHDYSYFHIETIDSFFQSVLRNFVRELKLSMMQRIELETDIIISSAVDQTMLSVETDENLKRWIKKFVEDKIENGNKNIRDDLSKMGKNLFNEAFMIAESKKTNLSENELLWSQEKLQKYFDSLRLLLKDYNNSIILPAKQMLKLISDNGYSVDDFSYKKNGVVGYITKIANEVFELPGTRANDCLSDYNKFSKNSKLLNSIGNELHYLLTQVCENIEANLKKINTINAILKQSYSLGLLSKIREEVHNYCRENNAFILAYNSLFLNKIIDGNEVPFVYEKIGNTFRHYMIDEFQDTSRLQWENFRPLIENSLSEGGKSLIVGDVKQSIYRFRNGDWQLLANQVNEDFLNRNIVNSLDCNWRSFKNIIRFNNYFFSRAIQIIISDFGNMFVNNTEEPNNLLKNAYQDVCQKFSDKSNEGGYVEVRFISDQSDDDETDSHKKEFYSQNVLEELPQLVEHLQLQKHIEPRDIVFLTNRNIECSEITNCFLHYKAEHPDSPCCFDIVSEESLLLSSADSISLIIAFLRLIVNPDDSISCYIVNYLARKFSPNPEDYKELSSNELLNNKIFSRVSLYEITESIIEQFSLNLHKSEVAYLQAFQDIVNNFASRKYSSIIAFLNWWDDKGCSRKLVLPESRNAMRVMTIHKSKGLEFNTVIIPYCNVDLKDTANNKNNTIWIDTNNIQKTGDKKLDEFIEQIANFPLIPVFCEKNLENSIFEKDYREEIFRQYIDNINKLYVAFTRAKQNLFVFCSQPRQTDDKELKARFGSYNKLLHNCLSQPIEIADTDNYAYIKDVHKKWDEKQSRFVFGELVVNQDSTQSAVETIKVSDYPIFDMLGKQSIENNSNVPRLVVATRNHDFFNDFDLNESSQNTRQHYGVIMHHLLENVKTAADFDASINRAYIEGNISDDEVQILKEKFTSYLKNPTIASWFGDGQRVFTESTIVLPHKGNEDGYLKRPDRFIIDGEHVTIVDFKFTSRESRSHRTQIAEYADLFKQMGYQTKAFLWYVEQNKVVEVE